MTARTVLPQPEPPDEFDLAVIIEWPPDNGSGAMPCWGTRILDAETEQPIYTISRMDLHWSADGIVWAEAEAFADYDGRLVRASGGAPAMIYPVVDAEGRKTGAITTGVFAFRVAAMRQATPFKPIPPAPVDEPDADAPQPAPRRWKYHAGASCGQPNEDGSCGCPGLEAES